MPENKPFILRFFNEIALYSGQYALFYIMMQFCAEGSTFWFNAGHVALLIALVIQTAALVYFGHNIVARIALSFLALMTYTLFEFIEGGLGYSFAHAGHLFFWVSTIVLAVLQYISYATKQKNILMTVEFLESNINMCIFIFIYFFFDLKLDLLKDVASGRISPSVANERLMIWHFFEGISSLFKDPAHAFVILGSIFLSLTIAYSRINILLLSQKIDSLLVRYIGPEARDKLIKRSSEATSTRFQTVILYCDLRNFTTLSEKADASDVVSMLNYYYGKWHETIKTFHGTINKFIGDALLSFFDGAPTLQENSSLAVQAALAMLARQGQMHQDLKALGLPTYEGLGIGIHCGEVILGDIGGERKDYTLIGDAVNTTARLEALCKAYNTPLIVSDACYTLLDEVLKKQFTSISSMKLKGKTENVTFYVLNSPQLFCDSAS